MTEHDDFILDKKISAYRELLKVEYNYTDVDLDSIEDAFCNKQLTLAHLRSALNMAYDSAATGFDRHRLQRPTKVRVQVPDKTVEAPPLQRVNETYDPGSCVAMSLSGWFKRLFH